MKKTDDGKAATNVYMDFSKIFDKADAEGSSTWDPRCVGKLGPKLA